MKFFSLDLYIYNLNMSRMWLIKTFPTIIVTFMLQTKTLRTNYSSTSGFLTKIFAGLLNSLVLTKYEKLKYFEMVTPQTYLILTKNGS